MAAQNFHCDFLKHVEGDLHAIHANFFGKIASIERQLSKSLGGRCLEKKCDDLMKENYEDHLAKFVHLKSSNARLLTELDNLKVGNCNDVDIELAQLALNEQKSFLLKRHAQLNMSKHLAIKVVSCLANELSLQQQKECALAVPVLANERLINSHQSQFAQIADDVNGEVQRLEKVFLRKYRQELKTKLEFDKLNRRLTGEIIPRLTQLERELLDANEELRSVNEEIIESRTQLKEFEETEEIYEVKLKNLQREHGKLLETNERMEKYLRKLTKGVASHEHKIERFKESFVDRLTDARESAGVAQRVKELEVDTLKQQLRESQVSTVCRLRALDTAVEELCRAISQVAENISKSTVTIEVFERNLKILTKKSQ